MTGGPARRACPLCGKPASMEHDPFCSRRCREIDLGNWLGGRYAIPTEERPEHGAGSGPDAADGAGRGDDDGPPRR